MSPLGGVQAVYNVRPDLTTLGKVIGGMPVRAFGGRRDVMQKIAPLGPVYQAGTLSGNPVAMAAGLKTLELIAMPGFFEALGAKVETLVQGMVAAAHKTGVPMTENHIGGMFGLFFTEADKVTDFAGSMACDQSVSAHFSTACSIMASTWPLRIRGRVRLRSAYRCGHQRHFERSRDGICRSRLRPVVDRVVFTLLNWLNSIRYAGWVVFAVALAESLAIVGVLVPGVVILLGAGTLIGAGILDFWLMCAWAVAGAIIGDGLSYWLGHHFEYLTGRWRWFRLHPRPPG